MKCVYKLKCRDANITEFYIGSSINYDNRKQNHYYHSNNLNCRIYCLPLYMFINVNGGIDNWEFEIIKEYKFITKKELNINEQYYKDLLKPQLNSVNAYERDMDRINNTKKISNNIKVNCPYCSKKMNRNNVKRHILNKHKEIVDLK